MPANPQIVHDRKALFALCENFRAAGDQVGFVPTMGALHPGHLSLVEAVRARGARRCVVSIFVNPLQFGPSEDFARYPRSFESDLAGCAAHGVDVIYAPAAESQYPPGYQTYVDVEALTQAWEGALRPGHFRGVATVVTQLLIAVGPCLAAFGRKDYQQWKVIERLVHDLGLPVEVLGCPIVREPDGLAMSSRNRYLDPAMRARALAIAEGLRRAHAAFTRGERRASALTAVARAPIETSFDRIDYVACADAESLLPIEGDLGARAVLLVAARLATQPGAEPSVRLIDNLVLGEDPPP